MSPRRYLALTPSLFFLLWLLMTVQQNYQPFTRALAQIAPDDLPINLIATNDSPQMAGTTVTLTATVASGSSAGLTYSWNFGDGQTAQGRVVQHTYAQEGTYSAFVIATNGPDSKRATTIVTIFPFITPQQTPVPIAGLKATSDSPVIAGNPVSFLATFVEGTDVTYTWNFGDGSPLVTGPSVSHVYPIPGKYTVTLRAENSLGAVTTTTQVDILDAPPKGLRIAHTNPLAINTAAFFTATVESGTNVQYQWSLSNGTLFYGPQFVYLFNKTDSYEVRVRAWNAAGEIFASEIITVQDQPPIIVKLFDNSPKAVNQSIDFLAQIQSNSPVVAYWRWGDGQVTEVRSKNEQSALPIKDINATHEYTDRNRYIVTLVVYNLGGSVYNEFIAYAETNKPSSSMPISWTPAMPVFGRAITFSVPLDDALYDCTWDFDDGTILPPGAPIVEYIYTRAGSYVVHVQCATAGNTQLIDADRIIHIGTTLFMPILASNGAFVREVPGGTGGGAIITATATPTVTATLVPSVAVTPTPTETPTVTPTETLAPGGTVPQATPMPAETPLGGTVPQITPLP